ncbi:hypothetical protein OESDEN_18689, partial [Oesophagostomum dentatum]
MSTISHVGEFHGNFYTPTECKEARCSTEESATESQHASNGISEPKIAGNVSADPYVSSCGLEDFEHHGNKVLANDQNGADTEDCDSDDTYVVDVVGDDSATPKTEKTQMETDEESEADSTKACKSDVEDEDSLDRCSTASTFASLSQLTELCLNDDSPQASP